MTWRLLLSMRNEMNMAYRELLGNGGTGMRSGEQGAWRYLHSK